MMYEEHLDAATVYQLECNRELARVSPEWYWRDFRLLFSRGRNHRSDERLERDEARLRRRWLRPWCGRSTGTSSQPKGGAIANDTIGTRA